MDDVKGNKFLNSISKFLFVILTLCLAFLGYILWFALKKRYPEQAKSCLIGSTIGSVLMILSIAMIFLIPDNPTIVTEEMNITKIDESKKINNTQNIEDISDNTDVSAKSYLPLAWLGNITTQIFSGDEGHKSALALFVIVCIVIYIISVLFSKNSSCIIVYGWKDFFLLVSPLLIITFILLFNIFYGKDHGKTIKADNIVANIIFLIPIILSFCVSVVSNLRHSEMPLSVIFAVISIIGKIVIMFFLGIFIIAFIGALGGYQGEKGKKDKRYKTGYRPGKNNSLIVIIIIAILGFLATVFIENIVKQPIDEMD